MSKPNNTRDLLIQLAEPLCSSAGYELVEIQYVREQGGWVVRVFIDDALTDAPTIASPVTFEDCERVSRELSALLDVEDPLPHAYRLEVSSPGLARPLRTAAHFRRYQGSQVKISCHDGVPTDKGPRRNFTGILLGVDSPDDDTDNVLLDVDGTEFALPLSDIASARLVPDWDALTARSTKPDAQGVA